MWRRPFVKSVTPKFWTHKQWVTAESIALLAVAGLIYYLSPAWGIPLLISWLIFALILGFRAYKGKYGFSRLGYSLIIIFCLILPLSAGFVLNTIIDDPNRPLFSFDNNTDISINSDQDNVTLSLTLNPTNVGKRSAYSFVAIVLASPLDSPSSISYWMLHRDPNVIQPNEATYFTDNLTQLRTSYNDTWLIYCEMNYRDGPYFWCKEYQQTPDWWFYSYKLGRLRNTRPEDIEPFGTTVTQFLNKMSKDERFSATWQEGK